GHGWCADAELIDVSPGRARAWLRLDCDATDTHALANSPVDGMYVRRVVRLDRPAGLQFDSSAALTVRRRHPCLETPVEARGDPRLAKDAWYQTVDAGGGRTAVLEDLPAGDSLFEFVVPLGDPVEIELIIRSQPAGK